MMSVLPVVVLVAYEAVFDSFFDFVENGVRVGVGHDKGFRTGTLLGILLDEGIAFVDFPLLVIEPAVGLVGIHALAVAIDILVLLSVVVLVSQGSQPSSVLDFQDVVVLHGVRHAYLTFFNVNPDDGGDVDNISEYGTGMVGNGIDGRRDDDTAGLLVKVAVTQ